VEAISSTLGGGPAARPPISVSVPDDPHRQPRAGRRLVAQWAL